MATASLTDWRTLPQPHHPAAQRTNRGNSSVPASAIRGISTENVREELGQCKFAHTLLRELPQSTRLLGEKEETGAVTREMTKVRQVMVIGHPLTDCNLTFFLFDSMHAHQHTPWSLPFLSTYTKLSVRIHTGWAPLSGVYLPSFGHSTVFHIND